MWLTSDQRAADSEGFGTHDMYGFQEVTLPALPDGNRLQLTQLTAHCDNDDDDEDIWADSGWSDADAMVWRRIERYVLDSEEEESHDDDIGVGGEIWPSAVALCASENGLLNKNWCNSVSVGSLNFP